MTTGEKIKERRLQLGITAEQLGDYIGVSKSTIGRYEKSSIKKIPYINLLHIAYALNTTIKALSADEKEPTGKDGELIDMIDQMEDLQKRIMKSVMELSPERAALVEAFVQGMVATDPKESADQT